MNYFDSSKIKFMKFIFSKFARFRKRKLLPPERLVQCDQMARLFFKYLPNSMSLLPNTNEPSKNCQRRLQMNISGDKFSPNLVTLVTLVPKK